MASSHKINTSSSVITSGRDTGGGGTGGRDSGGGDTGGGMLVVAETVGGDIGTGGRDACGFKISGD